MSRTIFVVGGGSGGHITPLLAVARAIKHKNPDTRIAHVGQRGENLQDRLDHDAIDDVLQITSGKFRRYHGESFLSHLLDVKTQALNIRDFFRFLRGVWQSWRLLGKTRPDAIFLKGGFVCVPVGIAARLRSIPYITHDSDAIPGLANRLTSKHARYNTTAMPADIYPYDQSKTVHVGVPLEPEFHKVSAKDKLQARQELGYDTDDFIVFSIGGGLGAEIVNDALCQAAPKLLADNNTLKIIHVTGKKLFDKTKQQYLHSLDPALVDRVNLIDFAHNVYLLSAASDIIITRAGATNVAEFAVQAKPTIIIPAPHLTGGQQLHNAKIIEKHDGAVIVHEPELDSLGDEVQRMINLSDDERQALGGRLHKVSLEGASEKIADILLGIAAGE